MPLFSIRWIPIFVLSLAPLYLAYASTAMRQPDSLVAAPGTIPSCALDCVEAFTVSDYPNAACSGLSDMDCLCRTNTVSSFTLGEAAYRCTVSFCPDEVVSSSNVYGICNSVGGALPMTHSVFTAMVFFTESATTSTTTAGISCPGSTATTTTTPISTSSVSSSGTRSSIISTTATRPITSTMVTSTNGVSTTPQSAFSATRPSSTPGTDHSIHSGAIAGISVASGISACFLIGIAAFFCCRRRRDRNRKPNKDHFFEIGGIMSEPLEFSLSPTRHPAHVLESSSDIGDRDQGSQTAPSHKTTQEGPYAFVTEPTADRLGGPQETGRVDFPMFPGSEAEPSPMSMSSQQTVSQLLPSKPLDALCPGPLRINRRGISRHASGVTLFEEDIQRHSRCIPDASHGSTVLPGMARDGRGNGKNHPLPAIGLPAHPGAMKHKRETSQTPVMRSSNQQMMPSYSSSGGSAQQAQENTGTCNLLSHEDSPSREPHRLVREIAASPFKSRPVEPFVPVNPVRDNITRPRIVRKNDIKRVQIGQGQQRSREPINPHSPNDFWRLSRSNPKS